MINATIITIYDPKPNFGNRLQNYATQFVIEKLGIATKTVSVSRCGLGWKRSIRYLLQRATGYRLPGNKEYWRNAPARIRAFERFNKRYIHTEQIKTVNEIEKTDYYILGSDQVWNPAWWYEDCDIKKNIYLLTFAKPEQKVCFSPSFSVDELPEEWIPWFKKHLASFPSFSVREEAGARLIKTLTGKDAVVTIDPTLMLNKEDWLKIADKPKKVDCSRKYVLTYFLGGRSEAIDKEIKEYAVKSGNAAVYNLLDYSQPELYAVDPSEFIYLIANAELVLTDSFHACVFSFLFGKPFLCYDRIGIENSMNSRMETLFGMLDLRRKYVKSGLPNELSECDYSAGYAALRSEREKLANFLKKSMHIE